jgi:hypothetical protein
LGMMVKMVKMDKSVKSVKSVNCMFYQIQLKFGLFNGSIDWYQLFPM